MRYTDQAKQDHERLLRDRTHVHARLLAQYATDDYFLARLGLLRGYHSAFVTAHQAIEKYLKSYLLHSGKAASLSELKTQVKQRGPAPTPAGLPAAHNLEALYVWAAQACEPVPSVLELLNKVYIERYPDNPHQPGSYSTAELRAVDELVFRIWGWQEQHQPHFFLTHGPFGYSFMALSEPDSLVPKMFLPVLAKQNAAYNAALALVLPKMRLLLEE